MGIKTYKPYTETRRFQTGLTFEEITTQTPYKPLVEPKTRISGRNNRGWLSIRHRGGGHKRRYRIIDFKRDKVGIVARVATVEYDPNRSAYISLLHYEGGRSGCLGSGSRYYGGQCPSLEEYPDRHDHSQYRAAARQRWPVGSECRG